MLNLESFKKIPWLTAIIDASFVVSFYFLFLFLGSFFTKKMESLNLDPAKLQEYIAGPSPEQFLASIEILRGFLVTYFLAMVLFFILLLAVFSLSRAYIWHRLTKKKFSFKKYARWNLLVPVLVLGAGIYAFIALFTKLIIMGTIRIFITSGRILQGISQTLDFALILIYIIIILLTFYHFTHSYKVFESLGKSFSTIKKKWKQLWPFFLFSLAVAFLPVIVTLPWIETLSFYPNEQVWFSAIFTFVYLAWLRGYLMLTINKSNS
jgi:hypothetical protein